jgi:cytoskeletal protein RodZ
MGAFGDSLRREREIRGITLAEISESTKISKRWLQALENEEFELLPGGVFNRGFVRSYAHFLGIDEEQAVADYVVASNEQPPPEDQFPLEIHEKPKSPPLNPKRSMVPVLLAILALVLVVGGWTFWVKHKAQVADQHSRTAATVPDQSSSSASREAASTNEEKPSNARTETRRTSRESNADPAGSFSVVIKAKQNSWISIAADGRTLWEGTLMENNERSVTAGKELVLKTGNAAGIEVSYNGKTLGALGKDKEVRTLTFNTAGLQQ